MALDEFKFIRLLGSVYMYDLSLDILDPVIAERVLCLFHKNEYNYSVLIECNNELDINLSLKCTFLLQM